MQTPNDVYKRLGQEIKWTDLMKPDALTIEFCWRIFASNVLVKQVTPDTVQYQEMKKAFFAGFLECFKIMNDLSTELTEDQACTILSKISDEANAFFDRLIKEHPIRGNQNG